MDPEVIKTLDKRARWDELQKFEPHQKSRIIDIPEEDLKTLCLQPCSVLISKFNVLTRISNAYDKECAKSNSFPNQETLELLFRTKGMKIYKNFNEPRLKWFEQQREFARYMRQQVLYYTTIIRLINRKRGDRILSDGPPLEIDSENFTAEISQVPQSTQKSQDESEVSDADVDAILSNLDAIY